MNVYPGDVAKGEPDCSILYLTATFIVPAFAKKGTFDFFSSFMKETCETLTLSKKWPECIYFSIDGHFCKTKFSTVTLSICLKILARMCV